MKKLLAIFLFLNIFLAYGCSGGKNHKNDIVGKWVLISSIPQTVKTSNVVTTAEIKEIFTFVPLSDSKVVMKLADDGKGSFVFTMGESDNKSDFEYTIKGDSMTISEIGRKINFTIVSIKDGVLKIEGDLTEFYKKIYPNADVSKATFVQEFKKE